MSSRSPRWLKGLLVFLTSYAVFSLLATAFHEYVHYLVLEALGGEGKVYFKIEPIFLPWDASTTLIYKPPIGDFGFFLFSASGGAVTALAFWLVYWRARDFPQRAALIFVIFHQAADPISEPLLQLTTASGLLGLRSALMSYQIALAISMLAAGLYVLRLDRNPTSATP